MASRTRVRCVPERRATAAAASCSVSWPPAWTTPGVLSVMVMVLLLGRAGHVAPAGQRAGRVNGEGDGEGVGLVHDLDDPVAGFLELAGSGGHVEQKFVMHRQSD